MSTKRLFPLLLVLAVAACQKSDSKPATASGSGTASGTGGTSAGSGTGTGTASGSAAGTGDQVAPTAEDLDSKDILARTEVADDVYVKHVLISWKDLAGAYTRMPQDPRGVARTNADAATLAKDVLAKLKADPTQIDALVTQYSEDPGSKSGKAYEVKADTPFMPEFKNLALRLAPSEVGIVKTAYGYHVMERVSPPPPDPLESADILARPPNKGEVLVRMMVIAWKDLADAFGGHPPGNSGTRTKAEADKAAQDAVAALTGGKGFEEVAKDSDIPDAAKQTIPLDDSKPFEVEEAKKLGVRLEEKEAGMVKTELGWIVVQRVPPPPPDPLESADILKREPQTDKAKVKHILLGWTEASTGQEPGKSRTRKDLEALVKKTLARIKKGEKFEDLMAELSEDGGSAKAGSTYDVTPTAQLVPGFIKLGLRLKVDEVGVVKSMFGMHIIKRVE